MPAGRPAIPKSATKFLNSKRRVIYMTSNGKYVAKSDKGQTVYNPKARFVKSPGGTERKLANSSARVPTAIRPKAVRKVRSNKDMKRGPYKAVAWNLPNPMGKGLRKVRANKGKKRGPRGLAMLAKMAAKA